MVPPSGSDYHTNNAKAKLSSQDLDDAFVSSSNEAQEADADRAGTYRINCIAALFKHASTDPVAVFAEGCDSS
jgi:hypothetical protein